MGEWGVEVPANLTWIKIHSFISSARKGIVGNSYKLQKIEETVFFCRVD